MLNDTQYENGSGKLTPLRRMIKSMPGKWTPSKALSLQHKMVVIDYRTDYDVMYVEAQGIVYIFTWICVGERGFDWLGFNFWIYVDLDYM